MRTLVVAIALGMAACEASAQQQQEELPALSAESQSALRDLRVQKLQGVMEDLDVDKKVKSQLLRSDNEELLRAALRDRSKLGAAALETSVRARVSLLDISRRAKADTETSEALKALGLDSQSLARIALDADQPIRTKGLVNLGFALSNSGKLVLLREKVLITKPEVIADDKLSPGQKLEGAPAKAAPVWRQGLRFAVLIGVRSGSGFAGVCSGTLVQQRWVVTAAHCLLDTSKGVRFDSDALRVFFPFQSGSETIPSSSLGVNRAMRGVKVATVAWIGDETSDAFPASEAGFAELIVAGKDLALLGLAAAEVANLKSPILPVRLAGGTPDIPPLSMLGYGVSDKPAEEGLALLVGVRQESPFGVAQNSSILVYGKNTPIQAGGICGGDSGGGLFAGRMDGTVQAPRLVGIVSALSGDADASNAIACMASQQVFVSLLFPRNRDFICSRAKGACD